MPTTYTIEIKDNFFDPEEKSVQVGDTVEWVHKGDHTHNVISEDGEEFKSDDLPSGSPPFTHTFTKAGDFPYVCTFHLPDMAGKIIVTAR